MVNNNQDMKDNVFQKVNFDEINDDFSNDNIEFDMDDELEDVGEIIEEKKEDVKWTQEQKQAINDRGKNLLVSASAGSGKTAVMTQRIVDLVCDEENKVPISKFLIVTFTNASAQDMKLKIIKRLSQMPQTDYILEQIDSIPTSDISDLHSFYSRLISTYFYEVEVDPSYHIIDEIESAFFKEKAITKLFEQKEKDDSDGYFKLFDILQQKRKDDKFKKIIYKFSEFLDSNIDGEKWFYDTIETAYNEDIDKNICANYVIDYAVNEVNTIKQKIEEFAEMSLNMGCVSYYNYFTEFSSKISAISKTKSFMVNANLISNFKAGKLPTVKDEAFADLKVEADKLNKKSKKVIENLGKFLFSSDEESLKNGIRETKQNLIELFNLTKEYNKIYSGLKREVNGLDFNDLEKYALKILSNPAICEAVRSKYEYVFVDEYQDINAIQEKIISMVSSINNRFMVGDLKQSIYGFRLCDPEIFLEKYRTYSQKQDICSVIKLNCNFRSDKKILKFVDTIFSGVMTEKFGGIDYEKESLFTPGEKNLDLPNSTTLCFIDTTSDSEKEMVSGEIYSVQNHTQEEDEETTAIIAEAKYFAQKFAEIKERSIKNNEKIKNSDFAVLVFARNKNVLTFIETLKKLGITVASDEKIDLMNKPYVQEILNFVKLANNKKDDYLIFKVMKSKLFNFSDEEIVEIRKINKNIRFYEFSYIVEKFENLNLKNKIINFLDVVNKYKKLLAMMTIKDFIKLIIKDFKLENLNLTNVDGITFNENIVKFVSSLPNVSVSEFLVNYKNFELEIQNQGGGDAVNIITVHKSKGLEFKYVFLINISRDINYESLNEKILFNKNFGVGFKNFNYEKRIEEYTIPYSAIKILEKQKIAEEQQRVLYVALTRAVEKMFIICSGKTDDLTKNFSGIPKSYLDWFKPLIYRELQGIHNEKLVFENLRLCDFKSDGEIEENKLKFYLENADDVKEFKYKFESSIKIPLKNSVSKILKNKALSEKNLNKESFINKDLNFAKNNDINENLVYEEDSYYDLKEKKIFGEILSSSAERGTAYHKILQNIDFYKLNDIESQLEQLKDKFKDEFLLVNSSDILEILKLPFFKSLSELGDYKILKEREFIASIPATVIDENAYDLDEIIMQGVVDLCVIFNDEIYILDYKTGKYSDEKLSNYKFQIETYAEIIERIFEKKVTKKLICFIDEKNIVIC